MVLGLAASMMFAAPARALAQDDVANTIIPALDLEQADVRDALRALFRNVRISYSIAPDVQGTVTVSLRNVTFETALQNILRQVDATFRVEAGVYQILKREPPPTIAPEVMGATTVPTNKIVRRIHIRSADPQLVLLLIRGGGNPFMSPELSRAAGSGTGGGRGGASVGGGTGGGFGGFGGTGGGTGGSLGGVGGGTGGRGGGVGGGGGEPGL
jgi:hypothetical protein